MGNKKRWQKCFKDVRDMTGSERNVKQSGEYWTQQQQIQSRNIILKTQSYKTHIQVFQVTSFGFVNKPSTDLFLSTAIQRNLSLLDGAS
jgi:hypothetical protein